MVAMDIKKNLEAALKSAEMEDYSTAISELERIVGMLTAEEKRSKKEVEESKKSIPWKLLDTAMVAIETESYSIAAEAVGNLKEYVEKSGTAGWVDTFSDSEFNDGVLSHLERIVKHNMLEISSTLNELVENIGVNTDDVVDSKVRIIKDYYRTIRRLSCIINTIPVRRSINRVNTLIETEKGFMETGVGHNDGMIETLEDLKKALKGIL